MAMILQVGNLAPSVGDQELLHLFEPHGRVCSAGVATHWGSGRSTGVGFVEMDCVASGDAAIAALNGQTYLGLVLVVCQSRREPGRRPAAAPESRHRA